MPTNEKYLNLSFPLRGLDLNDEFEEQPPGTTAVGDNVRARDILQLRLRGGQRPGMVKYVAQRIPEGPVLIQHLDYIVDPSAAALLNNFIDPGDDWVEDPLHPGTFVPPGGWGIQHGARFSGHAVLEAIAEIEAEGDAGTTGSISGTFGPGDGDPGTGVGLTSSGVPPAPQPPGSFSFSGLAPDTYNLTFILSGFPATKQIDYAGISIGSGGGTTVNLGPFSCEIDTIVLAGGDNFTGYDVPTKAFP